MDRIIRYGAYAVNIIFLIAVIVLAFNSHSSDTFIFFFIAVVPIISIASIYFGPDLEERTLTRELNKARLRHDLSAYKKKEK